MVLVRARQRKRQSVGVFAQEDIPPWFETEPLESEKCLPAGPRLSLPMKAGKLMMGRTEGKTSGPEAVNETARCLEARQ